MKLAILSRGENLYSTRRLKEAAEARDHTAEVMDTLKFCMSLEEGKPSLIYREKKVSRYDGIIPRIGASVTFFGTAVIRQFEQMGVYTLTPSNALSVSRD